MIIHSYENKQDLIKQVIALKPDTFPLQVEWGPYEVKRSLDQNRLQRMWMNELEAQGDHTAEEYRGYCKLHFGVPILLNENEEFAQQWYDRIKDRYTYEQKLEFMMEPFDFPITRLMKVKQKSKYLDKIYIYWTGKGKHLTEPTQ